MLIFQKKLINYFIDNDDLANYELAKKHQKEQIEFNQRISIYRKHKKNFPPEYFYEEADYYQNTDLATLQKDILINLHQILYTDAHFRFGSKSQAALETAIFSNQKIYKMLFDILYNNEKQMLEIAGRNTVLLKNEELKSFNYALYYYEYAAEALYLIHSLNLDFFSLTPEKIEFFVQQYLEQVDFQGNQRNYYLNTTHCILMLITILKRERTMDYYVRKFLDLHPVGFSGIKKDLFKLLHKFLLNSNDKKEIQLIKQAIYFYLEDEANDLETFIYSLVFTNKLKSFFEHSYFEILEFKKNIYFILFNKLNYLQTLYEEAQDQEYQNIVSTENNFWHSFRNKNTLRIPNTFQQFVKILANQAFDNCAYRYETEMARAILNFCGDYLEPEIRNFYLEKL